MHLHHPRPSHHAHSSLSRGGNLAAPAPVPRCSTRRRSRVGASTAPAGAPPDITGAPPHTIVCLELDAVVQGLEPLVTAWALAANAAVCPEIAACQFSPGVFTRAMASLLPALAQLHDAPLLLRLLHEEGIVGARSTAGREGPVVGRTVRRPLLINEVLEHWHAEIQPTCILRWSERVAADAAAAAAGSSEEEEDRSSCSSTSSSHSFEHQMQDAWEEAQASVPWRVLDTAQQQHGSSSGQPVQAQPAAGARTPQQPAAAVASSSTGSQSTSVAVLTAPAPAAATAYGGVTTAVVQPHVSIVQCINSCRQQVFVASTYPPAVTQAALVAVQLHDVHVLHGSSMQACVQQLKQQVSAAAAPGQALLVLSSPNRAAGLETQQQLCCQVGEWACRAPSLRAKALAAAQCVDAGDSSPRLGLLSECALAELLGVAECEAVMDGIAWRLRADA